MTTENKRLAIIMLTPFVLLLIPFIAMQLSSEVNWGLGDFVVAAILLIGSGLILEIIIRKFKVKRFQILLIVVLFASLVLIWAELAVGLFGTAFAGS